MKKLILMVTLISTVAFLGSLESKSLTYSDHVLNHAQTEVFAGDFRLEGNPCSGSGDSRCKKQGCTGQIGPQLCGGCGTEDSVEPMRC